MEHKLEKILNCQVCDSSSQKKHIEGLDHNVSGDPFVVCECLGCGFRFTNPRPTEENIYKYYQSKDYISHSGTKKGLVNRVYHLVRQYQFYKKRRLIEKSSLLKTGRLLDIGCGTGDFLNYMNSFGWKTDGVETDDGARDLAEKKLGKKIKKRLKEVREEDKYDVVTMWHVLEHVYDVKQCLQLIYKKLKKGGVLIVAVPNCESHDAKRYGENWAAYDLPIHLSHFRKEDIKNISHISNLTLRNIKPLVFDAYYISMLSAKKSSQSIFSGLLNGVASNLKAKKSGEYSSLMYFLFK